MFYPAIVADRSHLQEPLFCIPHMSGSNAFSGCYRRLNNRLEKTDPANTWPFPWDF